MLSCWPAAQWYGGWATLWRRAQLAAGILQTAPVILHCQSCCFPLQVPAGAGGHLGHRLCRLPGALLSVHFLVHLYLPSVSNLCTVLGIASAGRAAQQPVHHVPGLPPPKTKSLRLSALTTVGVSLSVPHPFLSIPLHRRWACPPPPPPSGCELPHSATRVGKHLARGWAGGCHAWAGRRARVSQLQRQQQLLACSRLGVRPQPAGRRGSRESCRCPAGGAILAGQGQMHLR